MANRWPDGGEEPSSKVGDIVFGVMGTGFIAGGVGYVLLFTLSMFGLRPPLYVAGGLWLALVIAALAWVRPWDRGPSTPSKPRRRPRPPPKVSGPWG